MKIKNEKNVKWLIIEIEDGNIISQYEWNSDDLEKMYKDEIDGVYEETMYWMDDDFPYVWYIDKYGVTKIYTYIEVNCDKNK